MSTELDLAALRRVAEACVASRRVLEAGKYRVDDVRLLAVRREAYRQSVTPEVVLALVRRVEEAEGGRDV